MSKIIALVVLTTLTLLPNNEFQKSKSKKSPPPPEMNVEVLFSGLMVFHLNKQTGSYEVGILSDADSPGHEFCVGRKGGQPTCRKDLAAGIGTRWTLSVATPPGGDPVKKGHGGIRTKDDLAGQWDFDWIVDLEGKEFHNKPLELEAGHLKPIIQLPKASLYTRYKSPEFFRWQGNKPEKPEVFGFVAETIGMNLKIKPGEEVVLKDEKTGGVIISVPYSPPTPVGPSDDILIVANVRPHNDHDMSSDFLMYYNLFKNIDKSEQYDFWIHEGQPLPFNVIPYKKTCCNLMCTEVLLSQRQDPLQ